MNDITLKPKYDKELHGIVISETMACNENLLPDWFKDRIKLTSGWRPTDEDFDRGFILQFVHNEEELKHEWDNIDNEVSEEETPVLFVAYNKCGMWNIHENDIVGVNDDSLFVITDNSDNVILQFFDMESGIK